MDFPVERVTGNQALVASSNLARAFDIDGVRLHIAIFTFRYAFGHSGIQASDDFHGTFSQVTDDFLAFIGKALAVLDLIDLRGI